MEIKLDHTQSSTLDALGVKLTQPQMSMKMAELSVNFLKSDGHKSSQLAEMIMNELTDAEILYICTQQVQHTIEQSLMEHGLMDIMNDNKNDLLN